ncbi:hypothetical protein DRW03_06745 [Corallococcus sp. H22C18031201]|uniref:hypothetical protein n=1 Tax=Citreicoccus inhibens TaxID=2849499 RepID=UPI000E716373|nr:hypothetical protein [Citreicoccus inhibens]MBU8895248.1 hypothetical protein [Citreicoccus inhibens]RJS26148.1 hypothetical protein DRW03_06745 [Corallococcus sp. H22C18031201]
MGPVSVLATVVMVLAGQGVQAQNREPGRSPQDPERLSPFGLMLDAGMPGGAGFSVAFRPSPHLQLHLGAAHNGLRGAARAGLTLLPLRGNVSPSLTLEAGHAQPADAQALSRRLEDRTQPPSSSMEGVGYTYASALVGFELHASRRLTFFVRGGVSCVQLQARGLAGLDEPFRHAVSPAEEKPWGLFELRPSAKLGFALFFF